MSALITEVVLTAMFLVVILGVTHKNAPAGFAPLAIGLALTLIHLISIPITNTSVNPSPADLAANAVPSVPLPPTRFSTIAGCEKRSVYRCAITRATVSVPPPGETVRSAATARAEKLARRRVTLPIAGRYRLSAA